MKPSRHEPLVKPLEEREDDGVPGAFYVVKGQCIICELPCETAPKNIRWNESHKEGADQPYPDHCRVVRQPETDDELDAMIEAAYGSCISAIRYCGTDEQTLERFKAQGIPELCDALPDASLSAPKFTQRRRSLWTRIRGIFNR